MDGEERIPVAFPTQLTLGKPDNFLEPTVGHGGKRGPLNILKT